MRKGIHIGPGMLRLMAGLFAAGALVVLVKEMPALRRYLKSESM
ncbi:MULTISPECIES: DUF6893 family small protein [Actinomadura]|uniref:Uncharacterized protein n=1 Tax=Actinomadura madurae TaxID=1993 RepID=A0A1I5RPU4_9ACTN|nr:hypothetical protein [Actinomadura madurae]SFP60572.1 hypothetical protein SAMN04489713_115203 [Actinomadura madurae]SPT59172.1 Uncharacterised protein [Actinomadura madurae]